LKFLIRGETSILWEVEITRDSEDVARFDVLQGFDDEAGVELPEVAQKALENLGQSTRILRVRCLDETNSPAAPEQPKAQIIDLKEIDLMDMLKATLAAHRKRS